MRCQQKLSEFEDTVPYCSSFQSEKISIGDTDIGLSFHGANWDDPLTKEIRTNWINYVLASEKDATAFQSAVFGRRLVSAFPTTKTTVLHDGIFGPFAFEEQFANIEMLRLWEDDGISTPDASGGVLPLLHVSSTFGEGWARWWMNSSRQRVYVKGDGDKCAKMKDMDITVVKPGTSAIAVEKFRRRSTTSELSYNAQKKDTNSNKRQTKRIPLKKVTGIRVEFRNPEDRDEFVSLSRQVQNDMLPLPDL